MDPSVFLSKILINRTDLLGIIKKCRIFVFKIGKNGCTNVNCRNRCVERLKYLSQLANLRHVSIDTLKY